MRGAATYFCRHLGSASSQPTSDADAGPKTNKTSGSAAAPPSLTQCAPLLCTTPGALRQWCCGAAARPLTNRWQGRRAAAAPDPPRRRCCPPARCRCPPRRRCCAPPPASHRPRYLPPRPPLHCRCNRAGPADGASALHWRAASGACSGSRVAAAFQRAPPPAAAAGPAPAAAAGRPPFLHRRHVAQHRVLNLPVHAR